VLLVFHSARGLPGPRCVLGALSLAGRPRAAGEPSPTSEPRPRRRRRHPRLRLRPGRGRPELHAPNRRRRVSTRPRFSMRTSRRTAATRRSSCLSGGTLGNLGYVVLTLRPDRLPPSLPRSANSIGGVTLNVEARSSGTSASTALRPALLSEPAGQDDLLLGRHQLVSSAKKRSSPGPRSSKAQRFRVKLQ
jgi:hypothetical protein